ncbi:MAG TPA: hypothetical protein VMH86_07530 [Rhizomicrobium sp.]|nr:hypothetical protein [Rhizomicrobium sp.]
MSDLVVRNVPDAVVDELNRRAARHGRSSEAEHRAILEGALGAPARSLAQKQEFWNRIDRLREDLRASGRTFTDSAILIREARDER